MAESDRTELEERRHEIKALRIMLRKRCVSITRFHKALRTMLEYFTEKEEDDFLDGDHTCPLIDHIYGSMVIVEEYLRGKR
jgi:hypothetical protein